MQLTDASASQTGGVLFNQALPTADGLQITFNEAQYGGSGADGIGFFLSDGSYDLTNTGASGGSLGYAYSTAGQGAVGGFLGVGLDAFGNYAGSNEGRGTGCTPPDSPGIAGTPTAATANSIGLRGPGSQDTSGNWTQGYCLLQTQHLSTTTQNLRATAANPALVSITVSPTAADGSVVVTVSLSFNGGTTFTQFLQQTIQNAPATVKFGFSGSTGGANDVHLVRNIKVQSINPLGDLSVVKQENQSSANYRTVYRVGDVIPYEFVVTNPGASSITGLTVDDPQLDSPAVCSTTTLAPAGQPGSSVTCMGSRTVTAADITSSTALVDHVNTVTVSGTVVGTPITATAQYTVELGTPSLSLTKSANVSSGLDLGDAVTYTFTVKNTGAIALPTVTITDPKLGIAAAACTTDLQPGDTATCTTTGTHTITQADILAGAQYQNSATATGTMPTGVTPAPVTADSTVTVTTVAPTTSLTLTKTADKTTGLKVGDAVGYTFTVTNSGNVTLAPVTVSDDDLGIVDAACAATLAPGATKTCTTTGAHTITDADVVAGEYVNTATSTGVPPTGSGLTDPTATATATVTTVGATAALSMTKTPDVTSGLVVGQTVHYSFTVTNTGTVTLTNASVTDEGADYGPVICAATLAPGATATCPSDATVEITQADLVAGHHDNTATSTAQAPAGSGLTPPTATASASVSTVTATTGLSMAKIATNTAPVAVGDNATFSFTVTNTGNTTLTDVTVTDPRAGLTDAVCVGTLAPGATATCDTTASVKVTSADVVLGQVANSATSTGRPPAPLPAPTSASSAVVPTVVATAGIILVKHANVSSITAGGAIQYTFTVTNTGTVNLAPVVVSDALLKIKDAACADTLAPDETVTCTTSGAYATTAGNLSSGKVVNIATVEGTTPDGFTGDPTVSATDSVTVAVKGGSPLAFTGANLWPWLAIAAFLLLLGAALAVTSRIRSRRS